VARRLQTDYIARNPNKTGQKALLVAAPGGSRYDAVHARFHAAMKRLAETLGVHDLNLMDAASGDVVYTVAKEVISAATCTMGLSLGPASHSQRSGRSIRRTAARRSSRTPHPYMPTYFAPQMFTAVPIIADGQTIGVFVAQVDIDALNDLLTDQNGWRQTGQGETGEVQLIGEDLLMRSQSRFMATDPNRFLAEVKANGTPSLIADRVRALGTTSKPSPSGMT
jgi:methyl-accepting chemotaxis protein